MSKILVVDDEPTIVELIRDTLSSEGYETVGALTGEEALQIMERNQPDLVILDLMLPGMDGYEVCRQMQRDPRLSQVPVIMLTALSGTKDMVAGYEKGADDYIAKPFDADELIVRVRAQLQHLTHEETSELTGLPGDRSVEKEIARKTEMADEPWSIVYVDIDNFREYNEAYSFLEGDELIRLAGKVLEEAVKKYGSPKDFVGHIGGDDFAIITSPDKVQAITDAAGQAFRTAVPRYYSPTDRQQGYIVTVDHGGSQRKVALASLSFDVVENTPDINA
jgi:diguanylate cyclase (GGDEF)-like protein